MMTFLSSFFFVEHPPRVQRTRRHGFESGESKMVFCCTPILSIGEIKMSDYRAG
jgi:hypothetical protein